MSDIVERLKENITYDPLTGVLTWATNQSNGKFKAGSEVGCICHGYRRFGFGGRKIPSHVAAWAIYHAEWPSGIVDHRNRDPLDNRIDNLRMATKAQNSYNQKISKNNKTGFKGVQLRSNGKYHAEISAGGKRIMLGSFQDKVSAAKAYNKAAISLHGEFAHVNNI
ncbi:HNH endonuclease [Agrobacterium rosae]|uniref:HNH endonuclease n=1 Tax=Agrobacterium rosae TaxID=1972867 RepID=UPI0019D36CF9|nr:HNH endonuclease [Agrobacterium rosae]MBN7804846.1 HNH endonuclease [Agrobacterium rosae]